MKFAGLAEIKKELQLLSPKKLQEVCLRLAKHKKENKELLAFLLFEDNDKQYFVSELKGELKDEFVKMSGQQNLFYVKKGLRRIIRQLNRYIKFLDDKALAVELLLWFCQQIKENAIPINRSQQLKNLYAVQLQKAVTLLKGVHEDLQADYQHLADELMAG